jgi:uncharacterized protein
MLLRAYAPSDLAAVHAINEAAAPAVASESTDELAHIAAQATIALVVEIDGEVAGFCLVLAPGADYGSVNYRWFGANYDDFVYLDRVAIATHFQRRGIGQALYAEVERLVVERRPDATHFTLEVNLRPRNDQSLAFHNGLGFVEVGRQESDHDTTVSLMAKPLTPPPIRNDH